MLSDKDIFNEYENSISNGIIFSKALTYTSFWNLSVSNIPIPVNIKSNEILVRVKAVSINPIDILLHRLSIFFIGAKTKVFCGDYSGIVVKAGDESGYESGDSVFGYILNPLSIKGTFSQYIVVNPKKSIFCDKIPKGMIYEQAASLSCVAATGYGALKLGLLKGKKSNQDLEGALKGKNILIIGAGTSVGSYAVEIAKKYMKANKIVVTCALRSEQRLEKNGADVLIDYTEGDLKNINEVLEFVKNNGKFDMVLDCVRNDSYYKYLNMILKKPNENGLFTRIYGVNSMNLFSTKLLSLILPTYISMKYWLLNKLGVFEFPIYTFKLSYDVTFKDVLHKMWERDELDTPIDSIFRGWEQYDLALHRVSTSKASGKVVCIL